MFSILRTFRPLGTNVWLYDKGDCISRWFTRRISKKGEVYLKKANNTHWSAEVAAAQHRTELHCTYLVSADHPENLLHAHTKTGVKIVTSQIIFRQFEVKDIQETKPMTCTNSVPERIRYLNETRPIFWVYPFRLFRSLDVCVPQ